MTKFTSGLHTPQMTSQLLEMFNKDTNQCWYDNSYGNDLVDSIEFEVTADKMIIVMLPNSFVDKSEDELFNTFSITDNDFADNHFISTDYAEVVKFINKTFKPNKHSIGKAIAETRDAIANGEDFETAEDKLFEMLSAMGFDLWNDSNKKHQLAIRNLCPKQICDYVQNTILPQL
tara:strand:- start:3451 stop:3975 length:525 start_codon:yes stop_codon:yes gene_type:complete